MIRSLLFLLSILVSCSALTAAEASRHTGAPHALEISNCNLPAPANLEATGATPTSLSFSWDPVAGTDGYEVLLIKVATGDPVYQDHIYTEFTTVGGLEPNTLYQFTVWSVCPGTGQLGGSSSLNAKTDYVIIDDAVVNLQFQQGASGNNFPLYQDHGNEPPMLFKVAYNNDTSIYTVFEVSKEMDGAWWGSVCSHHVKINHENGSKEIPSKWQIGSCEEVPYNPNTFLVGTAIVRYQTAPKTYECVMAITIPRNEECGTTLHWTPLRPNYEIIKSVDNEDETNRNKNVSQGNRASTQTDSEGQEVRANPNPFNHQLVLNAKHVDGEVAKVTLLDMASGRIFYQGTWTSGNTYSIPTAHLAAGAYMIRYEAANSTRMLKVIKTNTP